MSSGVSDIMVLRGNKDRNISSQIKLLISGLGPYREMFDLSNPVQVTDRDVQNAEEVNTDGTANIRVLKERFANSQQYISGHHFTIESLSAPGKFHD